MNQIQKRLEYIIKEEKVNATEDGIKALMRLAKGDMRKVLNMLQATHMGFNLVNEENVYLSTGNPLPRQIKSIVEVMLNEDFNVAYKEVSSMTVRDGLAISDILRDVHLYLSHIKLDNDILIHLYQQMSNIEYRLSKGATDKIQISALVAAFQLAREKIATSMED
eukprot:TRINITY_DN1074_c1_g1_i5.p1 TRINITY_DN1074_c1_g1~~TRINITY_DN1074_c1_g1_i5.p1  ORF type:complete len:165 (-),score=35.99 TRINITY_DN1074_c1_g1_i5:254-748(-)